MKKFIMILGFMVLVFLFQVGFGLCAQVEPEIEGCTVIGVGKNATVDGCVITSPCRTCENIQ